MEPVIETHGISKRYKNFQAVKDVSISIDKGEIYGFIGLNGSGKTTTIRMLLGMIKPSTGVCHIKGEKVTPSNHEIWKSVGHIVETPHSYPELTVTENLEICRRLRLVEDSSAVDKVMAQLNLTRYANKKAGNLSMGNAQRLGIAKALIHSPDILILDEPMNGLDPSGIVEVRELLQNLAFNKGVTVLLSSHQLNEVAMIATTIGIIHEGSLIEGISKNRLNALLDQQLIVDTLDNQSARSSLENAGHLSKINSHGLIEISSEHAIQNPDEISRLLVDNGFPPTRLMVQEKGLESYFLKTIEKGGEK